jgi:hypothetical protein
MIISMFFGETKTIWENKWFRWGASIAIIIVFIAILVDLLGLGELFLGVPAAAGIAGINIVEWAALIVVVGIIVLIVWVSKAPSGGSKTGG